MKQSKNIYKNDNFIPLPTVRTQIPPSMPLYKPLNECNVAYPTPKYNPSYTINQVIQQKYISYK